MVRELGLTSLVETELYDVGLTGVHDMSATGSVERHQHHSLTDVVHYVPLLVFLLENTSWVLYKR